MAKKDKIEYIKWKSMIYRCTGKYDHTQTYVEKGIEVCEEWKNSFDKFYEDMGDCPEGYTLDRIDNNQGYYKENCRWATWDEQAKNRGDFNDYFEYNGETLTLKDWSRKFNIKYTTLYQRIYRSGLSFKEAIKEDPFGKLIEINGEKHRLKEWCEIYNVEYELVRNRVCKHKWEPEEALTIPKGQKRKRNNELKI